MKKEKQKQNKPFSLDQEFIYSDRKSKIMEKCTVIECLDNQATLSNRVKVCFSNGEYARADKRPGNIYPYTEENKGKMDAYIAYFAILRKIDTIQRNMLRLDHLELDEEQQQNIIKLSSKITKLCTLLNL